MRIYDADLGLANVTRIGNEIDNESFNLSIPSVNLTIFKMSLDLRVLITSSLAWYYCRIRVRQIVEALFLLSFVLLPVFFFSFFHLLSSAITRSLVYQYQKEIHVGRKLVDIGTTTTSFRSRRTMNSVKLTH